MESLQEMNEMMWEYGKEQMWRSGLLFMDIYEDGSSNLL